MEYYGQYKQDKWLFDNHFKNKKDGFFLEIGADDGIRNSNTKFFEELGWNGMCIEPSHSRFKSLRTNRTCICENVALSDTIGEVEFMDISGWGRGLSGIVDKYDDRHKDRIQRELKHPENEGNQMITVKTELLSNLLDKHGITEVDFCTIDTEGGEFDIIKTIDFDKYKFNIILVENNYKETKVKDYLEGKGYNRVTTLTIDDVYIKE